MRKVTLRAVALGLCLPCMSVLGTTGMAYASSSPGPVVTLQSCGSGVSAVSITPAKAFDPLTAGNAELEANGYPFRPSGGSELSVWNAYVKTRPTLNTRCSDRQERKGVTHGPHPLKLLTTKAQTGQSAASGYVSHNWAGNVASGGYTDAVGTWTLPTARPGDGGNGGNSTTWAAVGTGNSSSYPLVQAGTQASYPSKGSSGSPIYTIWWEVFPQLSEQDQVQGVHPGDAISIHVQLRANYAGLHVVDLTQNYNKLFQYTTGRFGPDGKAEWIYERGPDRCYFGSCTYPPLANAPTRFTYAAASSNTSPLVPVGNTSHNYLFMYSCSGGLELAYPGAISNDSTAFSEVFVHTGSTDPEPC